MRTCTVCGEVNSAEDEACVRCSSPLGTLNPGSLDYLLANSDLNDDLSISGCSVVLADGNHSQPVDVAVYTTRNPLQPVWGGPEAPVVSFRGESISIFLDVAHPLFRGFRVRPQEVVASEIAQFLYENHHSLLAGKTRSLHTVTNLGWQILDGSNGRILCRTAGSVLPTTFENCSTGSVIVCVRLSRSGPQTSTLCWTRDRCGQWSATCCRAVRTSAKWPNSRQRAPSFPSLTTTLSPRSSVLTQISSSILRSGMFPTRL